MAYNCGYLSPTQSVQFGVSRRSVSGPLLFVLYTADLIRVVAIHGLILHQYADDCQIYTSTPVDDAAATVDRFSRCLDDVKAWLNSSRLRLNPAKTQVLWLGSKYQLHAQAQHSRRFSLVNICQNCRLSTRPGSGQWQWLNVRRLTASMQPVVQPITSCVSYERLRVRCQTTLSGQEDASSVIRVMPIALLQRATVWHLWRSDSTAADTEDRGCSRYRTQRHGSSLELVDVTTSLQYWDSFIGCLWSKESTLNWRCWCTSLCTRSRSTVVLPAGRLRTCHWGGTSVPQIIGRSHVVYRAATLEMMKGHETEPAFHHKIVVRCSQTLSGGWAWTAASTEQVY